MFALPGLVALAASDVGDLTWKVLDVRLGCPANVECTSATERHDVGRTAGCGGLLAKALVCVVRHEHLGFLDRRLELRGIELCRDGHTGLMRRELDAFARGKVIGRRRPW